MSRFGAPPVLPVALVSLTRLAVVPCRTVSNRLIKLATAGISFPFPYFSASVISSGVITAIDFVVVVAAALPLCLGVPKALGWDSPPPHSSESKCDVPMPRVSDPATFPKAVTTGLSSWSLRLGLAFRSGSSNPIFTVVAMSPLSFFHSTVSASNPHIDGDSPPPPAPKPVLSLPADCSEELGALTSSEPFRQPPFDKDGNMTAFSSLTQLPPTKGMGKDEEEVTGRMVSHPLSLSLAVQGRMTASFAFSSPPSPFPLPTHRPPSPASLPVGATMIIAPVPGSFSPGSDLLSPLSSSSPPGRLRRTLITSATNAVVVTVPSSLVKVEEEIPRLCCQSKGNSFSSFTLTSPTSSFFLIPMSEGMLRGNILEFMLFRYFSRLQSLLSPSGTPFATTGNLPIAEFRRLAISSPSSLLMLSPGSHNKSLVFFKPFSFSVNGILAILTPAVAPRSGVDFLCLSRHVFM